MEGDEIVVVLARAAELHIKLSDAIERSMKHEFQSGAGGARYLSIADGADDDDGGSGSGGSQQQQQQHYGAVMRYSGNGNGNGAGYSGGRGGDLVYDGAGGGGASAVADGSAEARSLGAIRDALEVLEEQLDALQSLQQQQRHEKDAALVDLEESRHILLRRLKAHRGREWEVVHEALAFAGEPVPERPDELPLPPYPRPVPSPSAYALEPRSPPFHVGPVGPGRAGGGGIGGAAKKLDMAAAHDDSDEVDQSSPGTPPGGGYLDDDETGQAAAAAAAGFSNAPPEEGTGSQQQHQNGEVDKAGKPAVLAGLRLPGDVFRLLVHALGISARAIGVVTVIAVIGYSEVRKRQAAHRRAKFAASRRASEAQLKQQQQRQVQQQKRQQQPTPPPPSPAARAPPPAPPRDFPEEFRCPPGKVRIYVDDVPKCVVRERFEVPFQQEVGAPDVMYGRG